MRAKFLATAATLLLTSVEASAVPVSYTFSNTFQGGSLAGTAFTVSLNYDTTAPLAFSAVGQNTYSIFSSFGTITTLGDSATLAGAVVSQSTFDDRVSFGVTSSSYVSLSDPTRAVLINVNLPTADLLSSFPAISLFYSGQAGTGSYARLNPPAVPEPATWAMMLTGFGLVGAAARRRKAALLTA